MFIQKRASSTEVAAHPMNTLGAILQRRRIRLCRRSFRAEAEFTMGAPMVYRYPDGPASENSSYVLLLYCCVSLEVGCDDLISLHPCHAGTG